PPAGFNRRWSALVLLVAISAAAWACDAPESGLGPTARAGGPVVKFDLDHKPLPEIPFPNDLATTPDPDSAIGRRVNISLIAPTTVERFIRERAYRLEGFSTFAPAWVAFDQPIDLLEMRRRHHLNDDLADDAVYLVDLETGEPVWLDLGRGNYPVSL